MRPEHDQAPAPDDRPTVPVPRPERDPEWLLGQLAEVEVRLASLQTRRLALIEELFADHEEVA